MLKRAAVFEKNEMLLSKLERWFKDDFFIHKLKIDEGNVNRFKYFAVENPKYQSKLMSSDKSLIELSLTEMAIEFNKLQVQKK